MYTVGKLRHRINELVYYVARNFWTPVFHSNSQYGQKGIRYKAKGQLTGQVLKRKLLKYRRWAKFHAKTVGESLGMHGEAKPTSQSVNPSFIFHHPSLVVTGAVFPTWNGNRQLIPETVSTKHLMQLQFPGPQCSLPSILTSMPSTSIETWCHLRTCCFMPKRLCQDHKDRLARDKWFECIFEPISHTIGFFRASQLFSSSCLHSRLSLLFFSPAALGSKRKRKERKSDTHTFFPACHFVLPCPSSFLFQYISLCYTVHTNTKTITVSILGLNLYEINRLFECEFCRYLEPVTFSLPIIMLEVYFPLIRSSYMN